MSRVKSGVVTHARHRKVIKAAKGFYGRRKNTFRTAQAAVVKAGVNAPARAAGARACNAAAPAA